MTRTYFLDALPVSESNLEKIQALDPHNTYDFRYLKNDSQESGGSKWLHVNGHMAFPQWGDLYVYYNEIDGLKAVRGRYVCKEFLPNGLVRLTAKVLDIEYYNYDLLKQLFLQHHGEGVTFKDDEWKVPCMIFKGKWYSPHNYYVHLTQDLFVTKKSGLWNCGFKELKNEV